MSRACTIFTLQLTCEATLHVHIAITSKFTIQEVITTLFFLYLQTSEAAWEFIMLPIFQAIVSFGKPDANVQVHIRQNDHTEPEEVRKPWLLLPAIWRLICTVTRILTPSTAREDEDYGPA